MLTTMSEGVRLEVDRGPNWLFVKVHPEGPGADFSQLANQIWEVATKNFVYRMVVEMDSIDDLPGETIAELAKLRVLLEEHGGALRVCGLSAPCTSKLEHYRLDSGITNHPSRVAAVLGVDSSKTYRAVTADHTDHAG